MEADARLRSTVVTVIMLDRPPMWDVLLDRLERIGRAMPMFRQRVVPTLPPAPPRWVHDPDFDLRYHVRRVSAPEPGTLETVLEMARFAEMDEFDHARPLWEVTLVDGLADGGAALVVKMHHSLADGIGGLQIAELLYDLTEKPRDLGPLPPEPEAVAPGPLGGLRHAVAYDAALVGKLVGGAVRGGARGAWCDGVRHPRRTLQSGLATAASVYRTVQPINETASPIMQGRRMVRELGVHEVPLSTLKDAAHLAGGTLNDAFLAGVTGGLRRYHEHHGAEVGDLRVTMPISIRADGRPGRREPDHPDAPGDAGGRGRPRGADPADPPACGGRAGRAVPPAHPGHRRRAEPAAPLVHRRHPAARRLPRQRRARHPRAGLARRRLGPDAVRLRPHHRRRRQRDAADLRRTPARSASTPTPARSPTSTSSRNAWSPASTRCSRSPRPGRRRTSGRHPAPTQQPRRSRHDRHPEHRAAEHHPAAAEPSDAVTSTRRRPAAAAASAFRELDQEQVDAIVDAMVRAGVRAAAELARLAIEETGFGVFEDKVVKNYVATEFLSDYLRDKRSVGVIEEDVERNIVRVAEPIGVVLAITPVTNPTSTVLYKAIVAAKTRNAVLFRPSPYAVRLLRAERRDPRARRRRPPACRPARCR